MQENVLTSYCILNYKTCWKSKSGLHYLLAALPWIASSFNTCYITLTSESTGNHHKCKVILLSGLVVMPHQSWWLSLIVELGKGVSEIV